MKIYLNISDIASFIGQNKYDYTTAFEKLFKKYDKDTFNNINRKLIDKKTDLIIKETQINENPNLDNKEILLKSLKESQEKIDLIIENNTITPIEKIKKELGSNIMEKINDNSIKIEDKKELANKIIKDNINLTQETEIFLLKETESIINKNYGVYKENEAIKLFEKKFNINLDTSQKYNCKEFKKELLCWYIGGKVDGLYISQDKSFLVEVKNRTKSFFNTLRDYENTQIQLYMWLLNLNEARLVEKFNNKIKTTFIYKDEIYINKILKYLNIFIKNFETKFYKNEKEMSFYLEQNISEKQLYIKNLYLNDILNCQLQELQESDTDNCLIDDLD